jgi:hypothetical protein
MEVRDVVTVYTLYKHYGEDKFWLILSSSEFEILPLIFTAFFYTE